LISSGHHWQDIQGYTLNQIGAFVRAASIAKEAKRKNSLYTVWMGFNADQPTINSLLKKPAKTTSSGKSEKDDWLRLAHDLRMIK